LSHLFDDILIGCELRNCSSLTCTERNSEVDCLGGLTSNLAELSNPRVKVCLRVALVCGDSVFIFDVMYDEAELDLTRVRVEIWEAVARDCWIDEVTINGITYSFEPASVSGSFRATVQ
jgi:hypothetical protein